MFAPTSESFPWRLFCLLFAAAILSALAILPIARDMMGVTLSKLELPPIPLPHL